MLGWIKLDGDRDNLSLFPCQSLLQKRMPGFPEIHLALLGYYRHAGFEIEGDLRFRHQEIHLTDIFRSLNQLGNIWPDEIAEYRENPLYLLGFIGLQGEYFVFKLNDFRWFNKGGFAGGRGVVYEPRNLLLAVAVDRNQKLSIPD